MRARLPRIPNRVARPLLLALIGWIGSGAVLLLSLFSPQIIQAQGKLDKPRMVSVEAAEKLVPFRIHVPKYVPQPGRLSGVRVGKITLQNAEQVQEHLRANTREEFGYGLVVTHDKGKTLVRSLAGSPAERAGIGRKELQLLAVNGYKVRPAEQEQKSMQEYLKMDLQQKRRVEKTNPPLSLRMSAVPLKLTLRDAAGGIRTIVIPNKEKFVFRPEKPSDPAEVGNRASLLFTIRGKQLVLHESRTVAGRVPAIPKDAEQIKVMGVEVWLSGPAEAPTAFWQYGGVDFLLSNYQHVISRAEVLRMIETIGDRNSP